jgi:predicted metal-dependent hydrolase
MCGPAGVWPAILGPLLRYLRPGFHPSQVASAPEAARWLRDQAAMYSIIVPPERD